MKAFLSIMFSLSLMLSASGYNPGNGLTLQDTSFIGNAQVEVQAQVGYLEVPENRENANSPTISVKFIRLKSTNPTPGAPLIYLEGGPGSSCSWQAGHPYYLERWRPFLEVGDVILVDQRGTGEASDRLTHIWMKPIPEDVFVDAEVAIDHFAQVNKEAIKTFDERGIDLRGYTTTQNAQDIDAIREALGYEKVSIMGFSYGTHLGLAYIRYFGENIENAILVGVEGPDHTFKFPLRLDNQFKKIALMAKEDSGLAGEVPDLLGLYQEVLEKLEKEPAVVEITSPLTRQPMKVKVGPFGLGLILRLDIGDASDIPVFPRLLTSIKNGDYDMLAWFTQKRFRSVYGTQAMSATMDLASGASKERLLRIAQEEKETIFPHLINISLDVAHMMKGIWPNPDLGSEFRAPLISNVRTLFMSGTLDCNTPPYQAEEVRWGFSNSSHIIVKNAGHEQITTHEAAEETLLKFLKGENVDDVALSHPPIQFIPVKGESKDLWHPSMGEK